MYLDCRRTKHIVWYSGCIWTVDGLWWYSERNRFLWITLSNNVHLSKINYILVIGIFNILEYVYADDVENVSGKEEDGYETGTKS